MLWPPTSWLLGHTIHLWLLCSWLPEPSPGNCYNQELGAEPWSQAAKGFLLNLLPSWVTSDDFFKVTMLPFPHLDKAAAKVAC